MVEEKEEIKFVPDVEKEIKLEFTEKASKKPKSVQI